MEVSMKRFFICLSFLALAAAAKTVNAQTGLAGHTYGGDRPAVEGSTDQAPGKLTGVVDKIEHYRNGLRLTIKTDNKKEYQYSLYYAGQGPQTSLSVEKKCNAALKSLDDLKVNDVIAIKIDAGNIKSLTLKERPADNGDNASAKAGDKPNEKQ
jgi:hypothetical protein